jgi:predicted Ser/Thr protein kinase
VREFLAQVRAAFLDRVDGEVRLSTGLVEESQYAELLDRYVAHVSLWLKGERYRDPHTGDYSDPDRTLLTRVENILEVKNAEEFRRNVINMVAAHAIDHPGDTMDYALIFPRYLEQVKEAHFSEHRVRIASLIREVLALLSDHGQGAALDGEAAKRAKASFESLQAKGYCKLCAPAVLGELLAERYV